MADTVYRDLNIPTKREGDEVTHTEFNTIVNTLAHAVCAVRCTKAEYDAMVSHDRMTLYFVDDTTTGKLLFWYIGDTLLCKDASAATAGFSYSFPLIF